MDANTLYDGLFTNDGLPIIVIIIGLPILFCFFFPIVCMLFAAIGALMPVFFAVISLVFQAILALFNCLKAQPEPEIVFTETAPRKATKRQTHKKTEPKKKPKPTYTNVEMDVAHGLKGLGLTLKDAKFLVKKANPDGQDLDAVSLMNKCLEAIKSD